MFMGLISSFLDCPATIALWDLARLMPEENRLKLFRKKCFEIMPIGKAVVFYYSFSFAFVFGCTLSDAIGGIIELCNRTNF